MSRISEINIDESTEEVKKAVNNHLAKGHKITSEKRTLLHNVEAFRALEESSYSLDDELQKLIGKRAADFYEYAISLENDCLVCSAYFTNLLKKNNIDFETFDFTKQEKLLIEYARAIVKNPKNIPDELFERLKEEFNEEEIVVITTMGVLMIANNYFNDILQVEPEEIID
ncbi:MAG: hypothetical protein K2H13_01135 [Eubacterium sp.]|nr:hypothetical protein [Eubacterium sp.]